MSLYWHGSVCNHVDPVGDEAEYVVGDSEPCVRCPYPKCVATVVSLNRRRSKRKAKQGTKP